MQGSEKFFSLLDTYKNRKILLYGDPDLDGLISLLLMCRFCDMLGLQYSYYVNDDRHHGFSLSPAKLSGMLVMAADFAITESEMERLDEYDVAVLSTDHHEVQDAMIETSTGVVVNNQYPFEPDADRYLSGAGVFFELVCSRYPEFDIDEHRGLVGITLLSDVREIENPRARAYLTKTYTMDVNDGYAAYIFGEFKDSYGFGSPKMDRNFIDYSLSPLVNALLRAGRLTEAIGFILGAGLPDYDAKGLQKSLMAAMDDRVRTLDYGVLKVIATRESDYSDFGVKIANYIGLYCNQYKDAHRGISVIGVVLNSSGEVVRASFRGRYDGLPYRSAFKSIGVAAEGHASAFGIQNMDAKTAPFQEMADLILDLEHGYVPEYKVLEVSNLAMWLTQKGYDTASTNCYVRDSRRTFIRYIGHGAKLVKTAYVKDSSGKEIVGEDGSCQVKSYEYMVDGRQVKSLNGVALEDGVICPVLDKGYVKLYVRHNLD